MNSKNPYSSPMETEARPMDPSAPAPAETIGAIAKRTFLAWEKLRVIYVGILGVETILFYVLANELFFEPNFWSMAIEGAIGAN